MTAPTPDEKPSTPTGLADLAATRYPPGRATYPNLFTLIAGQTWIHIGLGLSSLYGQHVGPDWTYFHGDKGFLALGIIHLCTAGLIIFGVNRAWAVARAACLISVSVYMAKACLFVSGDVHGLLNGRPVTYEATVWTIGMVFFSIVLYRESVCHQHDRRR